MKYLLPIVIVCAILLVVSTTSRADGTYRLVDCNEARAIVGAGCPDYCTVTQPEEDPMNCSGGVACITHCWEHLSKDCISGQGPPKLQCEGTYEYQQWNQTCIDCLPGGWPGVCVAGGSPYQQGPPALECLDCTQ